MSIEPAPSTVTAAAADRQLGRPVAAYRPDLASSGARTALWVIAVAAALLLVVGLTTGSLVAIIVAVPFLALFGYQAISREYVRGRVQGTALHLFEYGLVKTEQDGSVAPMRYDSTTMWFRFVVHKQTNGYVTSRKFHMHLTDLVTGRVCELYGFVDGQTWSDSIRRGVFDARQPTLVQQLGEGRPLTFGPLVISPAGLEAKGKSVPWAAVRDVTVDGGLGSIDIQGKRLPWFVATTEEVPDFDIAVHLIRSGLRPGGN
ncbi:DUF6585 family protein [Williamsia sp.]|uniref:DUF6585 family protein n=1 Tax=Williamsia sp. TaxID=1872085 RepID=UPI001A268583|nr:DUF6585 family protein [Williamsia sp.]MBJ7291307.1 hypothetical protein [Williamsia sp.]